MTLRELPKKCHCGKEMHLTEAQRLMIKNFGSGWPKYRQVKMLKGKTYQVPTYYIILHGLKYETLPDLNFPEWPKT